MVKKIDLKSDEYGGWVAEIYRLATAIRELQDKVFPDPPLCAVPGCKKPSIGFVEMGSKGFKIPTCRACCNDLHNIGPVFSEHQDGEVKSEDNQPNSGRAWRLRTELELRKVYGYVLGGDNPSHEIIWRMNGDGSEDPFLQEKRAVI